MASARLGKHPALDEELSSGQAALAEGWIPRLETFFYFSGLSNGAEVKEHIKDHLLSGNPTEKQRNWLNGA